MNTAAELQPIAAESGLHESVSRMSHKAKKTTRTLGTGEIMRRAVTVNPDKPKKPNKATVPQQKEN